MKKSILTLAIVSCISMNVFAQRGGGLFQFGADSDEEYNEVTNFFNYNSWDLDLVNPLLPSLPNHDLDTNQDAPLGGGVLLLIGFGAAYALKKKRE